MKPFFNVQKVEQVLGYAEALGTLAGESVVLLTAVGRTLAEDLSAPLDLPGFTRSTMDGYAVRSRDTFGASETSPGYLELIGEVLMGQKPAMRVTQGKCVRIGTGGMLPEGADSVIMVEHTRLLDDTTLEIIKSVPPAGNTLGPKDDAGQGDVLLKAGQRLRPQDVGLMAALGCTTAQVVRKPKVGVISTGDEVVPVSKNPGPGQVRDVNSYTLASQIIQSGGEPRLLGLVGDSEEDLKKKVAEALEDSDLVLLSGGSSVGVRDLTAGVFLSFEGAELLVHGVGVSPGKPFIWVRAGEKNLLGLPGQVASCAVAFHLFVEPCLEKLLGRPPRSFVHFIKKTAVLTRPLPSVPGREEYVRTRINNGGTGCTAEPVFGKSGLLTTLIKGQGLIKVPLHSEGLYEGDEVTVYMFPGQDS